MEVEATKSVPYRRLMLRAVQLSSEVYSSCGGEGLLCNVLYQLRPLNFQYPYRVKPLEILTSLWVSITHCPPPLTQGLRSGDNVSVWAGFSVPITV